MFEKTLAGASGTLNICRSSWVFEKPSGVEQLGGEVADVHELDVEHESDSLLVPQSRL